MAEGEKKKRKSPELTGPVTRREMTTVRDEVGAIRGIVLRLRSNEPAADEAFTRLDVLYTKLDRMDLRFKLHHDLEKKPKVKSK